MKILVNTSTLKATGVTQVAVSFINECKSFFQHEYHVYLSPTIASNLDLDSFPSNFTFYLFGKHSLYSVRGLFDIVRMTKLEHKINPDVVFSVFGPSLWSPRAPHLQGFAYPYYVYHDSPLFNILTYKEKFSAKIHELLHMFLMKKNGKFFVCETNDVANRLSRIHAIPQQNVFVVYNTANAYFFNYQKEVHTQKDNCFRFFTLCSPYKHKNMSILNKVIPLLKEKMKGRKFLFYTTFPDKDYLNIFHTDVREYIENIGPLSVAECPSVVEKCDALFLPSLLECYSASYPEAMCMGKPIATSNLSFARTVCESSALYFDPMDEKDISKILYSLITDKTTYNNLVEEGEKRLIEFGTAADRANNYLNICELIINSAKHFT